MSKSDEAAACFRSGFNCAQSVLAAFAEDYGLARQTALKISCGFGAGAGRLAGTCGAVSGALMVLGLANGQYLPGDKAAKEATYALVREFTRRFKSANGASQCRELLGCDIGTPEGMQKASDANLFKTLCPEFIRSAAAIVETMLLET